MDEIGPKLSWNGEILWVNLTASLHTYPFDNAIKIAVGVLAHFYISDKIGSVEGRFIIKFDFDISQSRFNYHRCFGVLFTVGSQYFFDLWLINMNWIFTGIRQY